MRRSWPHSCLSAVGPRLTPRRRLYVGWLLSRTRRSSAPAPLAQNGRSTVHTDEHPVASRVQRGGISRPSRGVTQADLKRWHEVAVELLVETDPMLDLPVDERPTAGIRGIGRDHSSVLRRGVAEGIAMVGSIDTDSLSDGALGADHARYVTRDILGRANGDSSGQLWRSLADVLPLLAEAAPQAFLDGVHEDLDQDAPLLGTMFQDSDRGSWLFSSSPHTGLLWALETLCWSAEYLREASRALARLQGIDPGGSLSNRPLKPAIHPRPLDSSNRGATRGEGERDCVNLPADSRRRLGPGGRALAISTLIHNATALPAVPRLEPRESERADSRVGRVHPEAR